MILITEQTLSNRIEILQGVVVMIILETFVFLRLLSKEAFPQKLINNYNEQIEK